MKARSPYSLFVECLPASWFREALASEGLRPDRAQVFTSALTCWLMVVQALHRGSSLSHALTELMAGSGAALSGDPERVRDGRLSCATGGYARARKRLATSLVVRVFDALFSSLTAGRVGAYLLDGTTMRAAASASLRGKYPPTANQHGVSHWPLLRVVVAHELHRALAARPAWGPMNGEEATSEQALAEEVLARLPAGSQVVADRNFGVFRVAWACKERGLVPVVRMTSTRAKALARKEGLPWGGEARVVWRPSADERRKYEDLPEGACVEGRLVAMRVPAKGRKEPLDLFLFTTDATSSPEELVALYALRWSVETDLRTLKSHLDLESLRALSPDMAGKELLLSVAAYDLVRALMGEAAELKGLDPRRLSFAWALSLSIAFGKETQEGEGTGTARKLLELVARKTNPQRKNRPHEERKIWPKPKGFPYRKCSEVKL